MSGSRSDRLLQLCMRAAGFAGVAVALSGCVSPYAAYYPYGGGPYYAGNPYGARPWQYPAPYNAAEVAPDAAPAQSSVTASSVTASSGTASADQVPAPGTDNEAGEPVHAAATVTASGPPGDTAIHYQIGNSWQAGAAWFYPAETFNLDRTGIAAVLPDSLDGRTADNEQYDRYAMTAAMPDVQLPAIATVTNLDNGLQVKLRINDRGPNDPGRVIAVTPGVATMLHITDAARVRVTFDPAQSMALSREVQGKSADLPIAASPLTPVGNARLPVLDGSAQENLLPVPHGPVVTQVASITPDVPLSLPPDVTQADADPGPIMVDAGSFTHQDAARKRLAGLSNAGARIIASREGGTTTYRVAAGPFGSIQEADAALQTILQDNAPDARIVVDTDAAGGPAVTQAVSPSIPACDATACATPSGPQVPL